MNIEEIIRDLERVAKKNNDRWAYRFDVTPNRKGGLIWSFECYETADQHAIVGARGSTPEEAALKAHTQLADALKQWGYSQ